ncbi:hypothetical protein V1508DRAFT_458109 [Lipomyces doorenjongii]|uniref:uncharacterized protein n=1 Tax=Lipomyces doorenjongii TaxID=383834 RepID=UPI0034CD489F
MAELPTPGLSPHGYIAIAEIVVYSIALVISVFNFRIVASALVIVVEESSDPSTGIIVAEMTVSNIALTPLLLATLEFLTTSAGLIFNDTIPAILTNLLRIVRLALTTAVVLGVVGAVELSNYGTYNTGHTLSRVSILLITAVFHNMLTVGITIALPFLCVRIIYSLLYAFSSSSANKFSTLTGDWKIYLGMDVVMEFVVLGVLTATGLLMHKFSGMAKIRHVGSTSAYEMA